MPYSFSTELTDDEGDFTVEVEFNPGHYTPARLHGHPDSWAPAEGEPAEILSVTTLNDEDEEVDILASLTEAHYEALLVECDRHAHDEQEDQEMARYDY